MATDPLKKWMRKENIYDNDLYDILISQDVHDPDEDFKTYTQDQWDFLWTKGCVARAKTLKDNNAKLRLEKKMKKLEKQWRTQSGIKSTSIKKKKKNKPASGDNDNDDNDDDATSPADQSSRSDLNDAMSQGTEIKKFLKKNQCYANDLLMVLVKMEIFAEADLAKIDSNSKFDEIYRQVRVLRAKELKDNASKLRMERTMTKLEKLWRTATKVKKTSITNNKKNKKKKKAAPKDVANDAMATSGADLKKWMKKNQIWEVTLYNELISNDICSKDQLSGIDQNTFDTLVRKVRVDRFAQLKDQNSRNRADKLLVRFEKQWRAASGIKKTSIKST